MNVLPLRQELGYLAVVESGVLSTGQVLHHSCCGFGNGVGGLSAPVAVDQGGGPFLPVVLQDSPDLAWADPQKLCSLGCRQAALQHLPEYRFSLLHLRMHHMGYCSWSYYCGQYHSQSRIIHLQILTGGADNSDFFGPSEARGVFAAGWMPP